MPDELASVVAKEEEEEEDAAILSHKVICRAKSACTIVRRLSLCLHKGQACGLEAALTL